MYTELLELIGGKGSRENIANEIANNNSTNEKNDEKACWCMQLSTSSHTLWVCLDMKLTDRDV